MVLNMTACAQPAFAEWLLVPFAGVAAGASSGYFDPDQAVTQTKPLVGGSVAKSWSRWYVEAEFADVPGLFTGEGEDAVIRTSNVVLLSGNALLRLPGPRRLTPYVVAGLGVMHVRIRDAANVFPLSSWRPALTVGGGVLVTMTARFRIRGDLRYTASDREEGIESSIGFGTTYLDFWRPSVGIAFVF